ncbi:CmcJ/NvfI family oxidoreductase [Bradyrhizobium sp. CB3481]|uniref:CmcJ/NvfI family oxidoreductase n=1 Tax=Bradyrhizobium sp. CB3481 TaxID=3039158 RepID=UPI0024B27F29|nr:CmcJ/NvfI family oxidoreductase [Bradyrhizobium sp. CB3481]WFU14558.1 CmcJ/NvfI family oxidoreductase [Bradyrhizobium sp. CB3481]
MGTAAAALSAMPAATEPFDGVCAKVAFVRRTAEEGPGYRGPERFGSPTVIDHDVDIRNARPIVNTLSLDREGFTLIQHKSATVNERDPKLAADEYVEEMNAFVKGYFNASWVTNLRHGTAAPPAQVRSPDAANGNQPTSRLSHIDYAAVSTPAVAAISDYEQGFKFRPYSRMLLIQTWRALSPGPQDYPLTLCDGSSVADADVVTAAFARDDIAAKVWLAHYNPLQRWYYFPDMSKDEFILFKGFDTETRFNSKVFHTAFDNRLAHPDAKPRLSVETRHLAYFE